MRSQGDWAEYTFEAIEKEIERIAGMHDVSPLDEAVAKVAEIFESSRDDLLPALDAILVSRNDQPLRELRVTIAKMKSHGSAEAFAHSWIPTGQHFVRDPRAQGDGGFRVPHHLRYQAWLMERASYGIQIGELAKLAKQAVKYLQYTLNMKGATVAKKDGAVFIGHGRSALWRDLKDLLQDRLGLKWDEFNRESPAGKATKERLEAMLANATFAFLVMTAEDEQADGSLQARANVIHEAGLFQGRLGFERAIILLEDGCNEFSNIMGLGQIRFPKGKILAASEDIRQVLEREKLL